MVKKRKGKRPDVRSKSKEDHNSDIDDADPSNENFFYDEIDQFHANKEKILLENVEPSDSDEFESEEEEVLGVESDGDEEEAEEDLDDSEEENDVEVIAGSKAWGKKRSMFYGADTHEGLEGSDREEAEREEEEEVLAIQRRLAEQIDEEDCGLDLLQTVNEAGGHGPEKDDMKSHVVADFSSLSRKAQWKLIKKEAPELEGLIEDFKTKISELENELSPLIKLIQCGTIPKGYGSDFIQLKYRVYLAYLLNISFYMTLKTSKTPVQHHPVISRLVQYRTVINRLGPLDKKLRPEIEELLSGHEDSNSANVRDVGAASPADGKMGIDTIFESEDGRVAFENLPRLLKTKKRPLTRESHEEPEVQDFSKSMSEKLMEEEKTDEGKKPDESFEGLDEKRRAINYEIAKNTGLKQKRKKVDRNPRVKMRQKYRKAKIRRRGQVREYKPEIKRYAGEASGIRIGVKKSVALR